MVYFGALICPFSTKSLLRLHGFQLTWLFFQGLQKPRKQRTPYNFKSWIVNWQFFTINSYKIQTNRNSGWIRLNWNDDCPWNHFLDCQLWLTCSIARSQFSKINYLCNVGNGYLRNFLRNCFVILWIFWGNFLKHFWNFFGILLEDFLKECFWRNFLEEHVLGVIFRDEFFGRIFLEKCYGGSFW